MKMRKRTPNNTSPSRDLDTETRTPARTINVRQSQTTQIRFSPIIGVRFFQVNDDGGTVWEETFETNNLEAIKTYHILDERTTRRCNDSSVTKSNVTETPVTAKRKKQRKTIRKPRKPKHCCSTELSYFIVEEVLDRRIRNGNVEFLIKWKDFPSDQNSWEHESNLNNSLVQKINEFIDS